jgi:hypothetical protein
MLLTLLIVEAADPATSLVVISVASEDVMHLVNKVQAEITISFVIGPVKQFKVVAHCERIRP